MLHYTFTRLQSQRTRFDAFPTFLQNSLFHGEKQEFRALRKLPFAERMAGTTERGRMRALRTLSSSDVLLLHNNALAVAESMKTEAQAHFSDEDYCEATQRYEEIVSLFRCGQLTASFSFPRDRVVPFAGSHSILLILTRAGFSTT